jgi:hypothetical protein
VRLLVERVVMFGFMGLLTGLAYRHLRVISRVDSPRRGRTLSSPVWSSQATLLSE